jgi:hypothetical protein
MQERKEQGTMRGGTPSSAAQMKERFPFCGLWAYISNRGRVPRTKQFVGWKGFCGKFSCHSSKVHEAELMAFIKRSEILTPAAAVADNAQITIEMGWSLP